MDFNTLVIIKSNLKLLNVLSALVSFFIGISPLFMNKDQISKPTRPFWVELSAVSFLLFTVLMYSLDFIADLPLYKAGSCLQYKNSYLTQLEFVEYYSRDKKLKVKLVGSDNYLVQNLKTSELYELPIKDDFKYSRCLK